MLVIDAPAMCVERNSTQKTQHAGYSGNSKNICRRIVGQVHIRCALLNMGMRGNSFFPHHHFILVDEAVAKGTRLDFVAPDVYAQISESYPTGDPECFRMLEKELLNELEVSFCLFLRFVSLFQYPLVTLVLDDSHILSHC